MSLLHLDVLFDDLVSLEPGQPLQPHVENRLRLYLRKTELLHQPPAGGFGIGRTPNEGDHGIEIVEGNDQALEDMGAIAGAGEIVGRAAHNHFAPVVEKVLQQLFEVENFGLVIDDPKEIDPKRGPHLGQLVEVVLHDLGHGVALELDHHPNAVAVGLVSQVRDAFEAFVVDQVRDLLHQASPC